MPSPTCLERNDFAKWSAFILIIYFNEIFLIFDHFEARSHCAERVLVSVCLPILLYTWCNNT
jgi:uncharacterized membrane protein